MGEKFDIPLGTLALMILKTLEAMGPQNGYGIGRRIEQTSGKAFSLNYGTLYPALIKLEQEGYIGSEGGASENNRKAKYYTLTSSGRRARERELAEEWESHLQMHIDDLVRSGIERGRQCASGDGSPTPPPTHAHAPCGRRRSTCNTWPFGYSPTRPPPSRCSPPVRA